MNSKLSPFCALGAAFVLFFSASIDAQQALYNHHKHSDMLPELSEQGSHQVGVLTHDAVNQAYINPMTQQNAPRSLTLEIWYPTQDTTTPLTSYSNELRSGTSFSIQANARRDAKLDESENWPLVVLSHGYTGYRTIMYYLGEHLASHGYIVVGIDHTDSTNAEIDMSTAPFAGFMSTLLNRARDQQFVLSYLGDTQNVSSMFGSQQSWSAESAGLIGYSMGGYGALNTVGACFDFPSELLAGFIQSQDEAQINAMKAVLNSCSAGQYPQMAEPKTDPKWKAMMAFAPWGGQHRLFEYSSVSKITVPSMLISGDLDDVSIYAGIQDIFAQFSSNDHYLLTFLNARHNIAPHPAPKEAWTVEIDYGHYYEPSWSSQRLNQINKHFALAMMDCHVKNISPACEYLDLSGSSNQTQDGGGLSKPWKGFDNRYSTGMTFDKGINKSKR